MYRIIIVISSLFLSANAFAAKASIEVDNRSDWHIHQLFLSPSSSSDWGPDQLRDDVIMSGDRYTLSGIACDTYDVRIIDEDQDECVMSEIRLCKSNQRLSIDNDTLLSCQNATENPTVASSGVVRINNRTMWDIYQLYLSSSSDSSWGDDLLGWSTWNSGDSLDLTTSGCGNYDLKMVDEDGDVCEVTEIYMCGDHGTIDLTDDDLLSCID